MKLVFARANASFLLPQDPICRLGEVIGDKIGLPGPLHRMPGKLTFTVTCADEHASRTGVSREFHVAVTISNYEGALQIERVLRRRAVQHAGSWLAAGTVICGDVRTIIDRVDIRAPFGKLFRHKLVHGVHERFRKVTAPDARLIGDHNDRQARFVEPVNGGRDKGKHTKTAGMIQVAHFLGDGPVAIQKNGGAQ